VFSKIILTSLYLVESLAWWDWPFNCFIVVYKYSFIHSVLSLAVLVAVVKPCVCVSVCRPVRRGAYKPTVPTSQVVSTVRGDQLVTGWQSCLRCTPGLVALILVHFLQFTSIFGEEVLGHNIFRGHGHPGYPLEAHLHLYECLWVTADVHILM